MAAIMFSQNFSTIFPYVISSDKSTSPRLPAETTETKQTNKKNPPKTNSPTPQ